MATKKRTTKRKATTRSKSPQMRSFHVAKDTAPFNSMKLTRQTAYWIILLGVIVISQLWIIKLQIEISNLSDTLLLMEQ